MCNSNIWPNSVPLQDIRLRNLSDLDFDLSMPRKIKCVGVIGLSIYGFLLMYAVAACLSLLFSCYSHSKCFLLSLIIRCKLQKSAPNYLKMTLNARGQRYPYMSNYCPRVPNFTPFCPIIEVFDFSIGYNGKFEVFERKSLKIGIPKFEK